MEEKELQQAIQKLLDDNGFELQVTRQIAHPATHHLLDPIAVSLVLNTLKFEIAIVKKK